MTKPQRVAYHVQGDDQALILFAYHPDQAARESDLHRPEVTRAPEFDRYRDGGLTDEVLLARGWWVHCAGCRRHVSYACALDITAMGEGALEAPMAPQFTAAGTFCSEACHQDYLDRQHAEAEQEERARQATLARFGPVVIERVVTHTATPYVTFIIPGGDPQSSGLGWDLGSTDVYGTPEAQDRLGEWLRAHGLGAQEH